MLLCSSIQFWKKNLAIWIVDRTTSSFVLVPMDGIEMESDIANLVQSMAPQRLEDMYDLLIRPVRNFIKNGNVVIVVPDKDLSKIPFSALLDKNSGKFLIEDYEVGVAPSFGIYVVSTRRSESLGNAPVTQALIVANPALRADVFPRWAGIPVGSEAKDLARLYKSSRLLIGKAATKTAFLKLAGTYQVVHFAGHAYVNMDRPALSGLALASDAMSSGRLYASDIYSSYFVNTRIVVLAGCDTAVGPGRGRDEFATLSRAFLSAGIPTVVGTLWRVEDRSTAFIMEEFHKEIAKGRGFMEALRRAQVSALKSSDNALKRPSSWGPFVIYGGSAASDTRVERGMP